MDFSTRTGQPRPVVSNGSHGDVVSASGSRKHDSGTQAEREGMWLRVTSVVLLFLVTVLLAALTAMFAFGGNNGQEAKYVNKDDYQAVFVNVNGTTGGQVYFGHIKDLTNQYIDLTNVFYIQNQSSGSSAANGAYTLVKLGCELHGPADQMVINDSQVYFWENLKPSGQVTQKINQFYRQNPNGQNCSQSSSNATQSSTNTQSSAPSVTPNSTPTTTPSTTSGSTKKP